MDFNMILRMMFSVLVMFGVGFLFYKNKMNEKDMDNLLVYLDTIDDSTGLVSVLAKYAEYAVHAVEQMVKAGMIPKENEARKNKAIEIVENCAAADGVFIDEDAEKVIGDLVESEVGDFNS